MSSESFSSVSSSYNSLSDTVSTARYADLPTVLVIDEVKITPGFMHFDNAYEGKRFKQKLIIQNCGKRSAFIRLCEPSTKIFEVSTFPQGLRLSSGMRITRTVKLTYKGAVGILKGFTNIWINQREIVYHFYVSLTEAVLSVEPQVIDFGKLNAVNRSTTKIFYVKNDGYKGTKVSIDLGRNTLGLTVKPMSAMIPAKTSVPFTMEILGATAGEFIEELWVKSEPPLRLVVMASFIEPKILVRKFISSLEFTHLEFPRTYYGGASTLPLLFRNFSSSNAMFCVMADVKGVCMSLEKAREVDENYRNFTLNPIEGRIASLKGTIIEITFAPIKNLKKKRSYAACFLKVVRIDCKDVDFEIYGSMITNDTSSDKYASPSISSHREDNSRSERTSHADIDLIFPDIEEPRDESQFSFLYSVGVCVYGEKETAGISVRPNLIHLSDLTIDRLYQRELLITNKSQHLPVRIKYQKLACIDVKPPEFELGPQGSVEVLMTIRTFKLDTVTRKITFDLFWKDTNPGENGAFRKVGAAHLKIHFETSDVAKKSRFDQCLLCTDLAEKLEWEHPYRLTETELSKKKRNDEYYLNYIRSLQKSATPQDQNLEPKFFLRLTEQCSTYSRKPMKALTSIIPLAPRFLYNIKIMPRSLRLQKVAPYTVTSGCFTIHNYNTFPIIVFMKSSKPCVVFDKQRFTIKGKQKITVPFSFSTTAIGKYNTNVDILVNDSTLFEATVQADVVPKTLKIENATIEFTEFDENYKFFKMMNHLNARATFRWDVPVGCYEINPLAGVIDAERSMYCMVKYNPDPGQPHTIECTLTSESDQQKIITIVCKKRKHSVLVDRSVIDAGVVPLNLPVQKKIVLQNLKNFQVLYSIDTDSLIPGIDVQPQHGTLDDLASEVFVITILMTAVIEFSVDIKLYIDNEESVRVNVKGVVDYPAIKITPDYLNFRKIAPNSFDVLPFRVQNLSRCELHITFPFDEYPEFNVSPLENDATHSQEVTLQPRESRLLFLNFHPQHISTVLLFLPCVINGTMGPVLLNNGATMKPEYFLKANTAIYEKFSEVKTLSIPRLLPVVNIYACATDYCLRFSNLNMNFVFFGEGHHNNSTYAEFEIINDGTETVAVCVRTDDLLLPFTLVPQTATNVEFYDLSYKIILEPKQKITFEGIFSPAVYDEYFIKLPIFLQHYCGNKVFNYVTMRGVYDLPKIIPSCEKCDFEPMPLDFTSNIRICLVLQNHFENCHITSTSDLNSISVIFDSKRETITREDSLLCVTLNHIPTKVGSLDSQVEFHCSCKASGVVNVTGVVENCLLTTHALSHMLQLTLEPERTSNGSNISENRSWNSLTRSRTFQTLVNENVTTYPLFPEENDRSQYAQYMRKIQKTLENWLFSQGYYMEIYRKIPEGFADFFHVDEEPKYGRSASSDTFVESPVLQLMMNFCGSKIKNRLKIQYPKSKDASDWLSYIYRLRCNILNYLRSRSAYLPHVKTKYLLAYEQYVQYEKLKHPEDAPMEKAVYHRLAKQCWIDLFLQIIKIFFLFPIVPLPGDQEEEEESMRLQRIPVESTRRRDPRKNFLETGIYGARERTLISWLQNCYDQERETLWNSVPGKKKIVFLDEDLQDGLILGAVTAHYCPYMRSEIKEMYVTPHSVEELHHNACLLIKTWKTLKFSFIILPMAFEDINMVEMLLLVTYLYGVLPNCTPKEEIKIKAALTQQNTTDVELQNLGDDPICYQVVLLNNKNNIFSARSSIVIPPHRTRTVKISFHAKSVTPVHATVLFAGETIGYKYAKNITLTLTGVPDVTYVCQEISMQVELFRPCAVTLSLESPFKIKATYSLHVGFISTRGKKVTYPWNKLSIIRTIKEADFQEATCEFDERGQATLTPVFCCEQIGPRNLWLSFTNPEIGDFGVKLTVKGIVTKQCYENIQVVIPKNYDQLICKCKNKKRPSNNCPKVLQVRLPMKNNPLWTARKNMIMKCVNEEEHPFWESHIFTPLGTRIIILLLDSETHPAREHIEETVEYSVEIKDNEKPFTTLQKVVVEDVTCEEFFEIPIHPLRDLLKAQKSILHLVSANGTEKRFYNLYFKSEKKISENVTKIEK